MSRLFLLSFRQVALFLFAVTLLNAEVRAQSAGWDAIPDDTAGLVFRVLDASHEVATSVTQAGYTTLQLASADGVLDIRKTIDEDGFVFFTSSELQASLSATDRSIARVNLLDPSGNEQRIAGHVAFSMSLDDLTEAGKHVDAVMYLFSEEALMPSDLYPRGGGDAFWNYFGPVERPMAMLIPPDARVSAIGAEVDKTPVLFLHGLFNGYPSWAGSEEGGYLNEISTAYDAWQLYYPYDQEIGKSATLLGRVLPRMLDPEDFGAAGIYGNPTEISAPVIAHGVGGLVARAYMQSAEALENKVSKLLMLGTPNHGTLLSYNALQYKGFSWFEAPGIFGPHYDRRAPAVDQTILGSKFVHALNAEALPVPPACVGGSVEDCYLVVAGTKDEEQGVFSSINGQEDGVVSVSSVSLLNQQVPMITASLDHNELAYALDASVLKGFLADRYTFARFAATHRLHEGDNLDGYYGVDDAGNTEAVHVDDNLLVTPDMGQIQVKLSVEDQDEYGYLYLWRKGGFSAFADGDEMRFEYGCSQLLGRKTDDRMRRLHHQEGTTRFEYIDNFYFSQRIKNHGSYFRSGFGFAEGDYTPVFYLRLHSNVGYPCAEFLRAPAPMSFRHLQTAMLDVAITPAQSVMMAADNHLALREASTRDNANQVTQQFQVDPSINAFVMHIRNADAAALRSTGFSLISPDGEVVQVDALALEGATFEEGQAGNHASFFIPNPKFGTWKAVYDEALAGISLHIPASSALAFSAEFEEVSYKEGDQVDFSLALPAALEVDRVQATLYAISTDGTAKQLQAVLVEPGADLTYTGYFEAAQAGAYSVLIDVAGAYEGMDTYRQVAIHTLVEGDIVEDVEAQPEAFLLEPNYPNPFNPSTTLRFNVPEDAQVKLSVYDVTGKQVGLLVDAYRAAGQHEAVWQATTRTGQTLSSGLYYAVLEIPSLGVRQARSMMLVK